MEKRRGMACHGVITCVAAYGSGKWHISGRRLPALALAWQALAKTIIKHQSIMA